MTRMALWTGTLLVCLCTSGALAQLAGDDSARRRRRDDAAEARRQAALREEQPADEDRPRREIPSEGFWPTRTMLMHVIDRITDDMADEYNFDDDQLERTRGLLKERFPDFLNENRAEIQTLMNEFFEAQLANEPPDPEFVADWAQRALPLLDQFREVVTETTDHMRDFMTDEQQVLLDAQVAAFGTGMTMVKNKVGIWAGGGYDPETEWVPLGRERERRDREERRRMEAAMEAAEQKSLADAGVATEDVAPAGAAASGAPAAPGPAPRAAATAETPTIGRKPKEAPKDEWARYVEDFCRRYKLNDEQTQQANRHLSAAQKERDDYLRRHTPDMDRVSKLLKDAKDDDEKKKAQAEFDKVNRPVDRMFATLKDKLDKLPTRKQRQEAAAADTTTESAGPPGTGSRPAETRPAGLAATTQPAPAVSSKP